jgi:7-cyano-7-deazaguanine reductase
MAPPARRGPLELSSYAPGVTEDEGLTLLGREARGPVEHVETFPAPQHCRRVRFMTEEVGSLCPVTGQPDVTSVVIDYSPSERCVESKSLKLYLWSFRDRAVFAEALAVEIATEIMRATEAHGVRVVATQHVRGGIVTECTAELGAPPT